MIVLTIGTMLPFDRLVRAVDRWAAGGRAVFAQIGDRAAYEPRHMEWTRLMPPDAFAQRVAQSRLLIAHAGTGSYFLASAQRRPIVLFPRRASLGEHNTDHQVETARWLGQRPGVFVAMTEDELPDAIERGLASAEAVEPVPPHAPAPFLARIREAIIG